MQGVISEEKVDSFNVPLIYLSVKAVKEILRRCDECFSIEWMEILEFKNIVAALQGMIEKHFGAEFPMLYQFTVVNFVILPKWIKVIFEFLKNGFQGISSSLDLSFEDDSVADEKIPFLAYLASTLKNSSYFPYELITIFLALLEDGIQVLVYAGEEDLICNWLGNSRWVHAMEWSGQKEFGAASTVPFFVDGAAAGTLKSHGPLAFLKVNEAGHMIPMDQPKAALQMLTNWMQGKLTPKKSGANVSPK
ncbi:hypothetical protein AHAS_Ahas17G0141900 [Arachis hypogaea]